MSSSPRTARLPDIYLTPDDMERLLALVDAYPGKRAMQPIKTRLSRVHVLTGVPLTDTACRDALERLGFTVTSTQSELTVTPPSVRTDVHREVDVIEEILRVTGYEQVPSTLPVLRQAPPVPPADRADVARRALAAAGVAELPGDAGSRRPASVRPASLRQSCSTGRSVTGTDSPAP